MDTALKQRLLGAAVLIALAIIFVPMLFSGSAPKQDSTTIDLQIPPAPDREFETRRLPVDAARPPTAPAEVPARSSEPVATVDAPVSTPVPASAPEPAQPVGAPAPTPAAPVANRATSTPTPAAAPPVATPPAGEAAQGTYFVHLGVYASAKNADDLVAALKRGGFAAFTEAAEFQGKPAQRVRVGPFAGRAEAEAVRIRVRQLKPDVPGSVVASAANAVADAPAAAVPADRAGGWAVQLGAFKTADDANKLRGRLQTAGFVAYVDKLASEGQTLWRVRAGPETDRANADKLRGRIRDKLKLDGIIVAQ